MWFKLLRSTQATWLCSDRTLNFWSTGELRRRPRVWRLLWMNVTVEDDHGVVIKKKWDWARGRCNTPSLQMSSWSPLRVWGDWLQLQSDSPLPLSLSALSSCSSGTRFLSCFLHLFPLSLFCYIFFPLHLIFRPPPCYYFVFSRLSLSSVLSRWVFKLSFIILAEKK